MRKVNSQGFSVLEVVLLFVVVGLVVAGGLYVASQQDDDDGDTTANTAQQDDAAADAPEAAATLPESDYLGAYTIADQSYGTEVTVTLTDTERVIVTNELPNHDTGEFPNSNNPNTISAQSGTRTYPLVPTFTGTPVDAREPGVAINGVKFEPATAERATCTSGETLNIEAIQDAADLGLDTNLAHVQPTGAYHYHGLPSVFADLYDTGSDLVHIGFAADGHLMYISKSNAYKPSYVLSTAPRSASGCSYATPAGGGTSIDENAAPGTFTQDYTFTQGSGDLDECNGITIDGQYIYLVTEEFPFVGRCLMGEAGGQATSTGGGQPPSSGGQSGQQGPPPR